MSKIIALGYVLGMVLGVVSVSMAQQPAPPQPERVYNLSLPISDIQYIAGVLQDKPYKEVAGLLGRMQQQITTQEAPKLPPSPETEPKKE